MQDCLSQAIAVFAPEKIGEQIDELHRIENPGNMGREPGTPLSQADFERINGKAGKGD